MTNKQQPVIRMFLGHNPVAPVQPVAEEVKVEEVVAEAPVKAKKKAKE